MFKQDGVFELPLQEHESLWAGSNTLTNTDPNAVTAPNAVADPNVIADPNTATPITDPNAIGTDPAISTPQPRQCPHTEAFFADPNHEAIIWQQRAEMEQRALAAQALAAQMEAEAIAAAEAGIVN